MSRDEGFVKAVRRYLGYRFIDYRYGEEEMALDHMECDSISELCKWFYERGRDESR